MKIEEEEEESGREEEKCLKVQDCYDYTRIRRRKIEESERSQAVCTTSHTRSSVALYREREREKSGAINKINKIK